jgi:hypothetical protein
MVSPRSPRYARLRKRASIRITDRDIQIVQAVGRHRFLRSTHLIALQVTSPQQILRRLQLLFQHGFLDRPRAQIDYYRRGSHAMVYGVGNRGAELLEKTCGVLRRKVDWSAKNRSVTRYFLEHTLAVADVMVALEVACRNRDGVRIKTDDEANVKWSVAVNDRGKSAHLPVVPDKIFKVEFPATPNVSIHILLEVDRATMPVMRHTLKQTSVYRKFVAYQKVWRDKRHTEFGMDRVRVLTVTTTPERVMNLIQAVRHLREKTPGLFLFTHAANLVLNPDPLNAHVLNGDGNEVNFLA